MSDSDECEEIEYVRLYNIEEKNKFFIDDLFKHQISDFLDFISNDILEIRYKFEIIKLKLEVNQDENKFEHKNSISCKVMIRFENEEDCENHKNK